LTVLVILDSNAFHGDVAADRGLLRSVLDASMAADDFELFVPEVVLGELDRHFAAETKKVVREVNVAIGDHRDELRRLGFEAPARIENDPLRVVGYRSRLEKRLEAAGGKVLNTPTDLRPAVDWAVNRRKPFKVTGEGFPDAVIWLSVIELAVERPDEEILLVSANSADFAESKKRKDELPAEFVTDLVERGCRPGQVRIVPGIGAFAAEIGVNFDAALERAQELVAGGAFEQALEERFVETSVEPDALALGFDLEERPSIERASVEEIEIEEAAELPGGKRLRIVTRVKLALSLELSIFRSEFILAEEEVQLTAGEVNFDNYYIEAGLETEVEVAVEILTDLDATEIHLDIGDLSPTDLELARRAVRGWGLRQLAEEAGKQLSGASVEGFTPEEAIESDVDETTVTEVDAEGEAELGELIEVDGSGLVCQVNLEITADIEWASFSPTPFDADYFASLTLNEDSGAPILQGHDSQVLLAVDLIATWDPGEPGWRDIELNTIEIAKSEMERRGGRMTAADAAEVERQIELSEAEDPPSSDSSGN
jgi:hypothetical protein